MKEIRNSSKKMSKGFTKTIDRKKTWGKPYFHSFCVLALCFRFLVKEAMPAM